MKSTRRLAAVLALLAISLFVFVLPVAAQDSDEVEPAPISQEEIEPAVTTTLPAESEAQLDWTYRYMIPTAIALGALVIVATAAQYFTSVVRKRYRILEE